jgi:hypothetical protein
MLKRISRFFIAIGLIAMFGPLFGFGVRGTDPSQNTPEIGIFMLLIGGVFYFFSTLGDKK